MSMTISGDAGITFPNGSTQTAAASLPAGVVLHFANSSAPSGWLECNGTAVSRTTYASLFSAIGTVYGAGDGSTTFNLPDLRGQFLRGWDNGAGVDPARAIGSSQTDTMQNLTGTFTNVEEPFGSGSGIFLGGPTGQRFYGGTGSSAYSASMTFDASRQARTSSENRPKNIAMLPCIKT